MYDINSVLYMTSLLIMGVYVRNGIESVDVQHLSGINDSIETIFVRCSVKNRKIVVGAVYRPPNSDVNIFIHRLEEIMDNLSGLMYVHKYICGDFNLNLLESTYCNDTQLFHV